MKMFSSLALVVAIGCFFTTTVSAQTITPIGVQSGSITPISGSGTITPIKGGKVKPVTKMLLPAIQECKTLDLAKGDIRFFREANQAPYSQIVSITSAFKGVANNDTMDGSKRYFDIELGKDYGLMGKTTPTPSESRMRTLTTHGLGALIADTSFQHFFQSQQGMSLQPTRYVLVKYNLNGKWAKFFSGTATICVQ
jgi:hypothetical protein